MRRGGLKPVSASGGKTGEMQKPNALFSTLSTTMLVIKNIIESIRGQVSPDPPNRKEKNVCM